MQESKSLAFVPRSQSGLERVILLIMSLSFLFCKTEMTISLISYLSEAFAKI